MVLITKEYFEKNNNGNFYDLTQKQIIQYFKDNPELLNNDYIKAFYSSSINAHSENFLYFPDDKFIPVWPIVCKPPLSISALA